MNDMETSAGTPKAASGMGKQGWRQASPRQPTSWLQLKYGRRLVVLALLLCAALLTLEAISAYVLYRHYSRLHRGFYPAGSATLALARAMKARADGRHEQVDLSIDHGPLFRSDPVLGYAMFSGEFRITERAGGLNHQFGLTVDPQGHRVTSHQPNGAARHLYVAGDSAMFGWGLDDEQTIPWLLQSRFPQLDVVNLSLNSYSTVHATLQLDLSPTAVTADDIVVLTYHPITNDFNVASSAMLSYLEGGFERQLGAPNLLQDIDIPFGMIDVDGKLVIRRYAVACALSNSSLGRCAHPAVSLSMATQVTMHIFDALLAHHVGHFVVAFLSGDDADPVIAHLRAKGVTIADLRTAPADPDANDEVTSDGHAGPFWHHNVADRLAEVLSSSQWLP